MQSTLWVNVIEPLVLHQQLHDGLIESRSEEQTRRERAFVEQLEDCAEGTRATTQQTTRVITARHLQQRLNTLIYSTVNTTFSTVTDNI